jgi:16S rRNA (cytosine1402-N4)-methyltransferase
MEFSHVTVLLKETVDSLNLKPNGIYVDGTLGGGGHSEYLLSQLGDGGKLIGIDQDLDAHKAAGERLARFGDKFVPVHSNFVSIKKVVEDLGLSGIDGMIMDLGVSSYQLDEADRGFSYMNDGALDMRMNRNAEVTAWHVINEYSEKSIYELIRDYGEEKWASRIAKFIVEARRNGEIKTTFELVDIIKAAIPAKARQDGPHPAKRTFQAIRIEVNNELGIISEVIKDGLSVMNSGGRMSIITFHSLEDRIVKQTYKELATGCKCPPEFPMCQCGEKPIAKVITRKPILPSDGEIEENPRSRSAKLRVIEKL